MATETINDAINRQSDRGFLLTFTTVFNRFDAKSASSIVDNGVMSISAARRGAVDWKRLHHSIRFLDLSFV